MNKENHTLYDESTENKKITSIFGERLCLNTKQPRVKPDRIMMYSADSKTEIKVNKEVVTPFFEPSILCFCKKPASRYDTPEYGVILECASYDESSPYFNPRFVCGFHVHERSWLKVRLHILNGFPIYSEYRELFTCPVYNFTFCALFNAKNNYESMPLTIPNCFCNRPTKLDYEKKTGSATSFITCSNSHIPGAPKCNYLNPSVVTVFPKSKFKIHRYIYSPYF